MGNVTFRDLISPDYLAQIRQLHAQRKWGDGGHKYAGAVRLLAREVGATSILDYGCGHGTLREHLPEFDVREYDPGIVGKDELPSAADIVVCSDVLEHIERDCIDAVLGHICGLTQKVCFAVISMRPAHTLLPDGRNAHLIVASVKWWIGFLETKDWTANVVERSDDQLIVCLRK